MNCYSALSLLICLLSRHQPEEARVRYLETRGALNRRSIRGVIQFLLVIQSVQLQNPQSSVSFQRNHLTTESKSASNSDKTSFFLHRRFKLVYILAHNSPLWLIEGHCFKAFPSKNFLSHQPNAISRY